LRVSPTIVPEVILSFALPRLIRPTALNASESKVVPMIALGLSNAEGRGPFGAVNIY
jgi:hypothetical protein